jgi:hypothetical protein
MFAVSTNEQCTGTLYQLARTNSIHPGHDSDLVPVDAGSIAVAPGGTQELDDPDSDGLELPEDDDATGSGFLAGASGLEGEPSPDAGAFFPSELDSAPSEPPALSEPAVDVVDVSPAATFAGFFWRLSFL